MRQNKATVSKVDVIALFTDFGLHGPYTGQMKAVLHAVAPGVPVIDLFADAPAGNPRAAPLRSWGRWGGAPPPAPRSSASSTPAWGGGGRRSSGRQTVVGMSAPATAFSSSSNVAPARPAAGTLSSGPSSSLPASTGAT